MSVDIVAVEARLTAVVRRSVAFVEMPQAQRDARGALAAALAAAGVRPLGPALTVWRPPQAGVIDYAPGVFVPHAFEAPDPVSLFTLPQGRAAHLRMNGPYDGLPAAWQSLFETCAARGLALAGLNWEVYAAQDAPAAAAGADLYALLA